jgi:hypothetical protein
VIDALSTIGSAPPNPVCWRPDRRAVPPDWAGSGRIRHLANRSPHGVVRHWSREREGAVSTGPRDAETVRPNVELLLLARGELPRARLRYWFRPPPTLRHPWLAARRRHDCFLYRGPAGLPGMRGPPKTPFQAHHAAPCFSERPSRPQRADTTCQDRQHDRSSGRRTTRSLFHRLPNKRLQQTRAVARPSAELWPLLLKRGTLGRLQRLGEFRFVRYRDRDPLISASSMSG